MEIINDKSRHDLAADIEKKYHANVAKMPILIRDAKLQTLEKHIELEEAYRKHGVDFNKTSVLS